jgi:hypothetical protein
MAMQIGEDLEGTAICKDTRNAFNELERYAVIPALLASANPAIRSLARAAVALLCPASPVLLGGGPSSACAPFVSVQGVQQGSVKGMLFFCLTLHSILAALPNPHGVVVSAIADDVAIAGQPAATCDLLPVLVARLGQELNMEAQPLKSEYAKGVRGGPGSEPRDTPAVRPAAGGSPVRMSQDDPSGSRAPQDASFKRKPRGGHPGTPTERSAAFKASAHASSAPRADASSPLAQELAVCEVEDEDTTSTMNQQELVGAVAPAANVEPHLAQEALAEEKNDANAAVSLLLKRQEEAE